MTATQKTNLRDLLNSFYRGCVERDMLPAVIVLFPADATQPGQYAIGIGTDDPELIRQGLREGLDPDTIYGGFVK